MKCQFCDSPATVHLTELVKKTRGKRELHLCEGCARKHNLIPDQPSPQIDLKALLGLLVNQFQHHAATDVAALTCPACGLKYTQFRSEGRLGCAAEYDAFRAALEPLLDRIHRSVAHAGKVPRAVRKQLRDAELRALRKAMQAAAKAEDYAEAARLRDLIRQKEALG